MKTPDVLGDAALDRTGQVSLQRQIYERIATGVLDGRLAPGARLPSTRSLAAQLSISRSTVDSAYQQLAGEGYIVTRGAAGTLIDPALDLGLLKPGRGVEIAEATQTTSASDPTRLGLGRLRPGLPALDAFPYKTWARIVAQRARSLKQADLAYQAPAGVERLRVQIMRYLAVARGISCVPAQIFITSGYQGALGLISRCLLEPGDTVWIEDPSYPLTREALRLTSARAVGVPVDAEGFDVAHAVFEAAPAKIAILTPTHHFPLGLNLSLPRRMAILEWASSANAWIVEDDYDSEFRYRGKPLPALKSLDLRDRVLYVGTFSKVLSPGLRVGYLVAPHSLVPRIAEIATGLQPPPCAFTEACIATFMEKGYLARHIRRMRRLYAERRAALVAALTKHAGPALTIDQHPGGMHLLARLTRTTDDVKLAERLAGMNFTPAPLSPCGVASPYEPGLLIGFTNVTVEDAPKVACRLAREINPSARHDVRS